MPELTDNKMLHSKVKLHYESQDKVTHEQTSIREIK